MVMQNKSGFLFTIDSFPKLFTVENLIAYFFAMFTGFILHELGHKISAQYFHFKSEFRADFNMLFFVFLLALFLRLVAAAFFQC